jgi:hypothetical protein
MLLPMSRRPLPKAQNLTIGSEMPMLSMAPYRILSKAKRFSLVALRDGFRGVEKQHKVCFAHD